MTNEFTELFSANLSLSGGWIPAAEAEYFPAVNRPDCHQLDTKNTLNEQDPAVILNTNPTGGGKTLSWAAPTIRSGESGDGWIVLVTYPTNALVEDQREKLLGLMRTYFGDPGTVNEILHTTSGGRGVVQTSEGRFELAKRVQKVTGQGTIGTSTSAELERVYDDALPASHAGLPTIILTTPDLLTLIANNRLDSPNARAVLMGVDAVVVDEFHLANPRARRLLPFYLDLFQNRLGARTPLENIVFLSATPDTAHVQQIRRGMDTTSVTREIYSESRQTFPTRQVLPEAALYSVPRKMFTNGRWLDTHAEAALSWIESGDEQALVVVDSVREVEKVAAAFDEATDNSVGRVYGWKTEGRQEAVDSADIVVGNAAVEVGVDFDRIDRLLTTAYTANSAVQRIGRMRSRDGLSDCEIALITSAEGHDALLRQATDGSISRTEFATAVGALGRPAATPYYGLLCAQYLEYLWSDAPNPLGETFRAQDHSTYKRAVDDHFGPDEGHLANRSASVDEFWQRLRDLRLEQYDNRPQHPIFEEMHTYRSSSISAAIIDETDPEEPLKEYSLAYLLRYGQGKFIPDSDAEAVYERVTGETMTETQRARLKTIQSRGSGTFDLRGFSETPTGVSITDFKQLEVWRQCYREAGDEHACTPQMLDDAEIHRLQGGIAGGEHLNIGGKPLAQYVACDQEKTRSRFDLGPYADVYPVSNNETIVLWQDALLAHAQLVNTQLVG